MKPRLRISLEHFFGLRKLSTLAVASFILKIELLAVILHELALGFIFGSTNRVMWSLFFSSLWLSMPLAFMLTCVIFLVINRLSVALVASTCLITTLTVIHYFKMQYLGLPLFFWDYQVAIEGLRAVTFLVDNKLIYGLLAVIAGAVAWLGWRLLQHDKIRLPWRARLSLAGSAMLYVIVVYSLVDIPFAKLFPKFGFRSSRVMDLGLLPFLAISSKYSGAYTVPPGYSEEAVAKIAAKYPGDGSNDVSPVITTKPDIIFYVIESLMDYQRVGIRYKQDPMPFFNTTMMDAGASNLISPAYGGETIQPEFELLTGFSQFLLSSPNPMAYLNQTLQSFLSLCDPLRANGYFCIGVNAVETDNFQRDRAYERMSFDAFVGLKTKFKHQTVKRVGDDHISDDLLGDTFWELRPKDQPVFSYIMTNSTHAQYGGWDLKSEYEVLNNEYSAATKASLQRYATAIHTADESLARFVKHVQESGRPALVIAYGDHLPGLLPEFMDMKLDRIAHWENKEKYTTPLRIWQTGVTLVKKNFTISPNLMAGLLQDFLPRGTALPLQFRIAQQLYKNYDAVSKILLKKDGSFYSRQEAASAKDETLHDYEIIQYDQLHGKRYSLKNSTKKAPH